MVASLAVSLVASLVASLAASIQSTALATAIRDSLWLFPAVEAVHLLALALLGGTVLLVDLRLLELGLVTYTPSMVEQAVRPWRRGALAVIIATGLLLFASQASGYVMNVPFRVKVVALVTAVVFSTLTRSRAVATGASVRMRQVVALTSIALWTIVGIAGRAIGFL